MRENGTSPYSNHLFLVLLIVAYMASLSLPFTSAPPLQHMKKKLKAFAFFLFLHTDYTTSQI